MQFNFLNRKIGYINLNEITDLKGDKYAKSIINKIYTSWNINIRLFNG